MIALDTNVLARYLVDDGPQQAEAARTLLAGLTPERPGFVCEEVAVELSWVLARAYGFSRDRIARLFEDLVGTAELHVEAHDDVIRSAEGYRRGGADFSDRIIGAAARRSGADVPYTFDRRVSRLPETARLSEAGS